jgi:hypothetical protein
MKVWIFQNNPSKANGFDVKATDPTRMWVSHFGNEMEEGNQVLLWRSGKDAGIYKIGKITKLPRGKIKNADINIKVTERLKSPILRKFLLKQPVLKNLSILRAPQGSNFKVTPTEWNLLKRLVRRHLQSETDEFQQTEEVAGTFNPKNMRDARRRILTSIVRRRGQRKFREDLLRIYGGKCLITNCDAEEALEAAHICPYKNQNTNHPTNGLLLRSDLHTLFDLHLISINASRKTLLLAPILRETSYARLEGQRLHFPATEPNKRALDAHRAEFERSQRP